MWSYWQGGKDHINAKILLVGQDWGDVKDAKEIIKRFNFENDNYPGNYCVFVDIIQLKVIPCLGRDTYEGVMKALGRKAKSGSYNIIIDEHTSSEAGGYKVFPIAHCGSMGMANRNKGKDKYEDKLHYQKEEWKAIKKYL